MKPASSFPGPARKLLATSVVARVPAAMLSIALLVHVQRLTGSYGIAGLAAGAYGLATGVGGPLLGRLADRRGQRRVLLLGATATAAQLIALALAPAQVPAALLVVLAAGIGFAQPPVGACLRAALPALVSGADAMRRAYAIESTAAELTFIAGPPIALAVSAAWSTRVALAGAGVALLGATALFAARAPDTRAGSAGAPRSRAGSLASPVIVALSLILTGVGFAFGAVEVSVTAAAAHAGTTAGAGPLLALWAVGSLVGGLLVARFGAQRLSLAAVAVALLLAHAAPALGVGNAVALAALMLLAGATIAPTYTVVYARAGDAAPEGTATEAFAWLATAVAVGAAAGAAIAGGVIDHAGPGAGFLVGGLGGLALAAPLLRRLVRREAVPARGPGPAPHRCA
jgi:MFS family permease